LQISLYFFLMHTQPPKAETRGNRHNNHASASALKRDHVLAVAAEAFLSDGYSATSSAVLAKSAGMSKKTLYTLFESKEQILQLVVERIQADIERETDPLYASSSVPVPERLRTLVARVSTAYTRIRSARVLADLKRYAPSLWLSFDQWRKWRFMLFRSMMLEGQRKGAIRHEFAIDDTLVVYAILMNAIMDDVWDLELHQASDDVGLLYSAFISMFLYGIEQPRKHTLPEHYFNATNIPHHVPTTIQCFKTYTATSERGQSVLESILDASEPLFRYNGYAAVTTELIAKTAGISKRTLYGHVQSKAEIVLRIAVRAGRTLSKTVTSDHFNALPLIQQLVQFTSLYSRVAAMIEPSFLAQLQRDDPRTGDRIEYFHQSFVREQLRTMLQTAQSRDLLRADCDHGTAAHLCFVLIQQLLRISPIPLVSPLPSASVCFAIVLQGIVVEQSDRRSKHRKRVENDC
jgi:AcrR family transcriptional regulator